MRSINQMFDISSCMLWFNFIRSSKFIFLCFKLIIIHYNTQKQKKSKFELGVKLNYNMHKKVILFLFCF